VPILLQKSGIKGTRQPTRFFEAIRCPPLDGSGGLDAAAPDAHATHAANAGGGRATTGRYPVRLTAPKAKKFASLKPSEMKVFSASDVLRWIERYRWNQDEVP
jgi:hypothetical protein